MKTQEITPELVNRLSYYTLCCLADHLGVVSPHMVSHLIVGTLTYDDDGNYISTDAILKSSNPIEIL